MPSRVIRGEILTSRSLARVSREAANLFLRLALAVDEFGRMDGRIRVVHGAVYGDRDDTSPEQVQEWLEELVAEGCVDLYVSGKDPVLRLPKMEKHRAKRNRAAKSRFPCRCGEHGPCDCSSDSSETPEAESESPSASDVGLGLGVRDHGLGVNESGEGGSGGESVPPPAVRPRARGPTDPPEALDEDQREKLRAWRSGRDPDDPALRLTDRQLDAAAEACLDWHRGKGRRAKDWVATIRTWIRRDLQRSESPRSPPNRPNSGRARSIPGSENVHPISGWEHG